jgi:hypothetical protein
MSVFGMADAESVGRSWTEDCTYGSNFSVVPLWGEVQIAASSVVLSLPLASSDCNWYRSSLDGLIFTAVLLPSPHLESVTFFVGVPNKFFLRMSLTLPPPFGVPFTSFLISFFGLGDSLPGVTRPGVSLPSFLFSGLGVTLPVFTCGVAALLAGLLTTIFLSGISIEK